MAARAVAQAGKCTFANSPQSSRGTDSELIVSLLMLRWLRCSLVKQRCGKSCPQPHLLQGQRQRQFSGS
jgi:hypothetical protein